MVCEGKIFIYFLFTVFIGIFIFLKMLAILKSKMVGEDAH